MTKEKKEGKLKKKFKFDQEGSEYNFQLKKKPNLWWLLLFLLLLLLFIPLKKDIVVLTQCDGKAEPYVDVRMQYTSRYLLWEKQFLNNVPYDTIQQTDSTGMTVFKDVGYSVYSFIFHFRSQAVFSAKGDCFEDIEVARRFHTTRKVVMEMQPLLTDVRLKVVDAELCFEIPDAAVECSYRGKGGSSELTDSTDVAGCVVVRNVRVCGGVESIMVSAEGYADTLLTNLTVKELLKDAGGYLIPLRPLKERFTFFVKNKYTKEPIPGAIAEVSLTERGIDVSSGKTRTNVDGLGQGFYDNARVMAKVSITAEKKPHYKSGKLEGDYTVKQFKELPDSLRVIWLVPEPFTVEFRNLDTLTGEPIAGVHNEVFIEGVDGSTSSKEVVSNRNGCFPVSAREGDKITIKSTLDPYYHPKTSIISKFEKGDTIYMYPVLVTLDFRTVEIDEDDRLTGELPDCDLEIIVDGEKVAPTNSGTGSFSVVNLRLTSTISIIASKPEYNTNDTKIQNRNVGELYKSMPEERDIEMYKFARYHVDIVMCIDNTGSMDKLIQLVKNNALSFYSDLNDVCATFGKKVVDSRLRVISYGDLMEKPIVESGFLEIPSQSADFKNFVNGIVASGGDDEPEDGLEALAMAIDSKWNNSTKHCRHIIIVYTDASCHELGFCRHSPYYPSGMPADFSDLTRQWLGMDPESSRLILFAPTTKHWSRMNSNWPNVYMRPLSDVIGGGYEEVLKAISNSL